MKPCLVCGEPSPESRCADHQRPHPNKRPGRGYDNAWQKLSRRARKASPFCEDCGTVDDLQADHSPEAWRRKAKGLPIRLQDIAVVCGPCNRERGAARTAEEKLSHAVRTFPSWHEVAKQLASRRREVPTWGRGVAATSPDPRAKAKSPLHLGNLYNPEVVPVRETS